VPPDRIAGLNVPNRFSHDYSREEITKKINGVHAAYNIVMHAYDYCAHNKRGDDDVVFIGSYDDKISQNA